MKNFDFFKIEFKSGALFMNKEKLSLWEASPISGIIKNDVSWNKRILVFRDDYLLFIQYHNLTKKTAARPTWPNSKKIPGAIFLTPCGKTAWADYLKIEWGFESL